MLHSRRNGEKKKASEQAAREKRENSWQGYKEDVVRVVLLPCARQTRELVSLPLVN